MNHLERELRAFLDRHPKQPNQLADTYPVRGTELDALRAALDSTVRVATSAQDWPPSVPAPQGLVHR